MKVAAVRQILNLNHMEDKGSLNLLNQSWWRNLNIDKYADDKHGLPVLTVWNNRFILWI